MFGQKALCTVLTALSNSNWKQWIESGLGFVWFSPRFRNLNLDQLKAASTVSHTNDSFHKTAWSPGFDVETVDTQMHELWYFPLKTVTLSCMCFGINQIFPYIFPKISWEGFGFD